MGDLARAVRSRKSTRKPREGAATGEEQPPALNEPVHDDFKEAVTSRIIELLDSANVPESGRASILAGLTRRNRQTATGWLTKASLPDLRSFKSLVEALQGDAYYILGISRTERKPFNAAIAPRAERVLSKPADNIGMLLGSMSDDARLLWFAGNYCADPGLLLLRPMIGDAMDPLVKHNEVMGIDTTVRNIDGNGIYALEKDSKLFVRRVEEHLEDGITLHCQNPAYKSLQIKGLADPALRGVSILGKVVCVVKSFS